jgi:hypothetical protein
MALDLTPNNGGLPHYECIILSRSILLGFGLWAPFVWPCVSSPLAYEQRERHKVLALCPLLRLVLVGFIRVLWVLNRLMWHHINEER